MVCLPRAYVYDGLEFIQVATEPTGGCMTIVCAKTTVHTCHYYCMHTVTQVMTGAFPQWESLVHFVEEQDDGTTIVGAQPGRERACGTRFVIAPFGALTFGALAALLETPANRAHGSTTDRISPRQVRSRSRGR